MNVCIYAQTFRSDYHWADAYLHYFKFPEYVRAEGVKEVFCWNEQKNGRIQLKYKANMQANGKITSYEKFHRNKPTFRYAYVYTNDTLPAFMYTISPKNDTTSRIYRTYDERGNCIDTKSFQHQRLRYHFTSEYSIKNQLICHSIYNKKGEIKQQYKYEYDSAGNLKEFRYEQGKKVKKRIVYDCSSFEDKHATQQVCKNQTHLPHGEFMLSQINTQRKNRPIQHLQHYTNDTLLLDYTLVDVHRNESRQLIFRYLPNTRQVTEIDYIIKQQLKSKTNYVYDAHGRCKEGKTADKHGQLKEHIFFQYND